VPTWQGKEQVVKDALNYFAKLVYVDQKRLGEINPERLAKLQDFYLEKGFIQKKTPVEELYTNQFIK
jgi:NitT/TauT family transport system substrate-binding protein